MKVLVLLFLATFSLATSGADGTIIFYNRFLSAPNGCTYHAPIEGITDVASARAQLYLVTGSGATATYTPLTPLQTFRPAPNEEFFLESVDVTVPGQSPGTTGLKFVVRYWQGAASYDQAIERGESNLITVHAPLGGADSQGKVFPSPNLGGVDGWGDPPGPRFISFVIVNGDTLRFDVAAFFACSNADTYILEWSPDLQTWTPILTNSAAITSFTVPHDPESTETGHFRLRLLFPAVGDGTIIFHNRNLSAVGGGTYNVPIEGITDAATARAQLFLVTGSNGFQTYTALTPLQTFRPEPNEEFFIVPQTVAVPGQPPGRTGVRFIVRAWQGAATYDEATTRYQSNLITVRAPLGGIGPEGVWIDPPDLGGPEGWIP